jgi:hypothetical protein
MQAVAVVALAVMEELLAVLLVEVLLEAEEMVELPLLELRELLTEAEAEAEAADKVDLTVGLAVQE